jgi:polyhydroxyalkanoate synthesis regulator phasin
MNLKQTLKKALLSETSAKVEALESQVFNLAAELKDEKQLNSEQARDFAFHLADQKQKLKDWQRVLLAQRNTIDNLSAYAVGCLIFFLLTFGLNVYNLLLIRRIL